MILHFSFFIVSCLLSMMNFVLHHQYEIKKKTPPKPCPSFFFLIHIQNISEIHFCITDIPHEVVQCIKGAIPVHGIPIRVFDQLLDFVAIVKSHTTEVACFHTCFSGAWTR